MATLTPETSDYLGMSGGGGYFVPPTTAPIPGSPSGATFWNGGQPVLLPGAPSPKPSCGGRCGGGGTGTTPPPTGGGNIPSSGGSGATPFAPSNTQSLVATETVREQMPRNWLWLAVAAGVGYWLGTQKK